nr:precorrin-8X methylmutase [uncultured Caproiciproducens sp.]
MKVELQNVLPAEIEKRSFELIGQELGNRKLNPQYESVIKRVIHTTADFEYADTLYFSTDAVQKGIEAVQNGACIVTDTQMGKAGINKKTLAQFGGEVFCFMSDEDVAARAKQNGTTRATASMEKAAKLNLPLIFAIGNAPTALIRLYELMEDGVIQPQLVIGVPVGFVNVIESKELMLSRKDIPVIISRGRKGGSNVAAAICNAILYAAGGCRASI